MHKQGSVDAVPVTAVASEVIEQQDFIRSRNLFVRGLWVRGGARLCFGGLLLVAIGIIAIIGPWLVPHDPLGTNFQAPSQAPSREHWLGTDPLGRDVFSRVIVGSRLAFQVGFVAVATSIVIGVTLGMLAGYIGRWVDTLIMVWVNSLLALPLLIVALAIVAAFGPSLMNIMIAIGVASSPAITRVVRAQILSAREMAYVEAAMVVGAAPARIMVRHLLPNIVAPLIVLGSLRIATAILAEASLSFLGLGIQPPDPSWGSMANYGRAYFQAAPWLVFAPVGAIFVTVLAWNFFGDGMRDYLDPRLRR